MIKKASSSNLLQFNDLNYFILLVIDFLATSKYISVILAPVAAAKKALLAPHSYLE